MRGESLSARRIAVPGSVVVLVAVHLVALVAFPDGVTLPTLLAVESIVGAGVTLAVVVAGESRPWALVSGLAVLVSAVGAWLLATGVADLWLAGAVVLVGGAAGSYVTHRYELVVLGLLEEIS